MEIRPFQSDDEEAVVELWTNCGLVVPWNNPHYDVAHKVKVQADMFLVAFLNERLVATFMTGYDCHPGWIYYLAVHRDHQGRGIGKSMMDEAEDRLRAAGCSKINLQVRSTNTKVIGFYKNIGFKEDDVVSLGKRLGSDQ